MAVTAVAAQGDGLDIFRTPGLVEYPYEVIYDSKRDGPVVPAHVRSASAGLVDVPYEVVYDSKRDGKVGTPQFQQFVANYRSTGGRSGYQQTRMGNTGYQGQSKMMGGYQQQYTRMGGYQGNQQQMGTGYHGSQQKYTRMGGYHGNNQMNYRQSKQMSGSTNYNQYSAMPSRGYSSGAGNLRNIEYEVVYDSKRDGPNSEKANMFRNLPGYVDVPYEVVFDSKNQY